MSKPPGSTPRSTLSPPTDLRQATDSVVKVSSSSTRSSSKPASTSSTSSNTRTTTSSHPWSSRGRSTERPRCSPSPPSAHRRLRLRVRTDPRTALLDGDDADPASSFSRPPKNHAPMDARASEDSGAGRTSPSAALRYLSSPTPPILRNRHRQTGQHHPPVRQTPQKNASSSSSSSKTSSSPWSSPMVNNTAAAATTTTTTATITTTTMWSPQSMSWQTTPSTEESSMATPLAGNVTRWEDPSRFLQAHWVCLSLLVDARFSSPEATSSPTMDRLSTNLSTLLLPSPDRIVRQSLQRHIRFHVTLAGAAATNTTYASSHPKDPKKVATTTWVDLDDDPDWLEFESRAWRYLQESDLDGARQVYQAWWQDLVQDQDAQQADVAHRVAFLSMAVGRNREAMQYYQSLAQDTGTTTSSLSSPPPPRSTPFSSSRNQGTPPAHHQNSSVPTTNSTTTSQLKQALHTIHLGLVEFASNKAGRALKSWRQGLQMACSSVGYEHVYVAILLCNMGVLHFVLDDLPSSLRALEESLELQRAILRSSTQLGHIDPALFGIATTMGNLAMACHRTRQYDRAVELLEESLALYGSIQTGQDYHSDLEEKVVVSNLYCIVQERDQLEWKENALLPTIETSESAESMDSSRSSSLFGNSDGIPSRRSAVKCTLEVADNHDFLVLGPLAPEWTPEARVRETVLTWFGRQVDEAVKFIAFEEFMSNDSLAKESIVVDLDAGVIVNAELCLTQIHRQAMIHLDKSEFSDAIELFQSALRSHKSKYGETHHLVGSAWHNIGTVYMFAKQYDLARQAFTEAVETRTVALGANHPDVHLSIMKLGLIQLASNDLKGALSTFWDIRSKYLEVLGYGHPQLAKIMNNIGCVMVEYGDYPGAKQCFEMAHEYQLLAKGAVDDEGEIAAVARANTLSNLGFTCAKMGNVPMALEQYRESLSLSSKYLNESDSRVSSVQENIQYLSRTQYADNSFATSWSLEDFSDGSYVFFQNNPSVNSSDIQVGCLGASQQICPQALIHHGKNLMKLTCPHR